MADLLHRLECGLYRSAGASERLRSQVDRIDGYMRTSRIANLPTALPHPNGAVVPVDTKPESIIPPAPYPQAGPGPPVATTAAPMNNHMLQFHLPPELLANWPWPLDSSNSEGFFPLAVEWCE